MTTHELKTWPKPFQKVVDGTKKFELRKNDRGFEEGDRLRLREWDPDTSEYTGREFWVVVTYLSDSVEWGLQPDHVCMSIHPTGVPAANDG